MDIKKIKKAQKELFNFATENNILARIIKLENDTKQRFDILEKNTEQRFAGIENELKELRRALVKQRTKETRN